ncbi:HopJ type III effector protein [Pseudarcicella hirudinis]|uniref:HopJ type III effector protein n=1 Tax=Pseudarcicella hirudinis TaxID=1079859 RepID=A0A1I5VBE5_9BACT|nr:HopJ type III effector protein [Pseudarcicella hirudinis]SFQ04833.1 HopJ type III effector protein [Pseudarcicella hirudinis]
MSLVNFLNELQTKPENIEFPGVIAAIDQYYDFEPTAFQNGETRNEAGQNSGSCKLFSFAQLQGFTKQQTLDCFGAYYRTDVLGNPEGTDHQNIRNFIRFGWEGIKFEGEALRLK